jgi:protein-L-isoaspartate(D-aspartate) O-methyltransferase
MDRVSQAFTEMDRINFIPYDKKFMSDTDAPIPIGFGQTNSQPSTVKRMLEWLDAKPGNKVLDVGSGSGWTTALLSSIIGTKGMVFAVEIIPELLKFGELNCKKFGIQNAKFKLANSDSYGLPENAPFDRILVSASVKGLPEKLLEQLEIGGKIVIPVQNDILEITKILSKKYTTDIHQGYIFVPLV